MSEETGGLMVILFLLLIHFLPTVIACMRGHHNKLAIFLVNLFFGWTIFGWFIAFIWACTSVRRETIIIVNQQY